MGTRIQGRSYEMFRDQEIAEVLKCWGIHYGRIRADIPIAGSPDRCEFRVVVEDRKQNLFILESVFSESVTHKKKIARTLAFLEEKGLSQIRSYLPWEKDKYIVCWENSFWQVAPYVEGIPLQRPGYAFESWRGSVLADFLIELWGKSRELPLFDKSSPFSIVDFIQDFVNKIEHYAPFLYRQVQPALEFLEGGFMKVQDGLPVRFCHGDYHPLNVIWYESEMRAVIDWEFLGYKPEIYDVAMLIGCVGMEKPQSLTGDLVFEFVGRLKESGLITEISWSFLFEFVLALRFAWLSDWLKRSDTEMIDLEAVYIRLLLENRGVFTRSWGI
jgi:homoserine kinase type II